MSGSLIIYSVRNDFTGLATAALNAWMPIVSKAIIIANIPATAKTHTCILIL